VFLIEEVPRKLRRVFDASTAKFGLTRTQWRALAYIFRTPGLTQTELAKCLELERASVGHIIDQLRKGGLCRAPRGRRQSKSMDVTHTSESRQHTAFAESRS
jgi:MarR family transcriptional regulator for hemolysin